MNTLEQVIEILQSHRGLESSVPVGHCYWDLLNRYRGGLEDSFECTFEAGPLNPAPPPPAQAQDKIKLAALRKENRDALALYRGETNIPYTHSYWFNLNVIKDIERKPE